MAYIVRFSPEALNQLDELETYIANTASSTIAARYIDSIVGYCENLQVFPYRGVRRDDIRSAMRTIGFNRRITIVFDVVETENIVILLAFSMAARTMKQYCKFSVIPCIPRVFTLSFL